jgi:hypothetical protein
MSFSGNEADVKALATGVYLLRTTDKDGTLYTIRIVVGR